MSYYALYKERITAAVAGIDKTLKIHDIFDDLLIIPVQSVPKGFYTEPVPWNYECIYTLIANDKNIDGTISDEITYIGEPVGDNMFEFHIPRRSDVYRVISDVPYSCVFKNEKTGLILAECRKILSSCDRIKIRHILLIQDLHVFLHASWF